MTSKVEEEVVVLEWLPPEETNGLLLGFDIGYQSGKPVLRSYSPSGQID